jgi:hypothetical protein
MRGYEGLVRKMKGYEGKADYDRMLSRIEERVSRRRATVRLALAGTLVGLLLAFAGYYYYPARQAESGGVLMSYVFEHESVDGPLLDYVFGE